MFKPGDRVRLVKEKPKNKFYERMEWPSITAIGAMDKILIVQEVGESKVLGKYVKYVAEGSDYPWYIHPQFLEKV